MYNVIDKESCLKEGNGNHKDCRGPAGELLRVGEGLCHALQRRGLLCRQTVVADSLQEDLHSNGEYIF